MKTPTTDFSNTKEIFTEHFTKHLHKTREIGKHLLKIGKNDTSVIIGHEIIVDDSVVKIRSTITLLPVRRIYKQGDRLLEDDALTHEMLESDLL